MEHQSLTVLLDQLEQGGKAHICALDVSGLLSGELLGLSPDRRIHSGRFCSAAKSTDRGLELCLSCKRLTNRKALQEKHPFWGRCPYGLSEVVWPVCDQGEVKVILFVGNLVQNREETLHCIHKACCLTSVDEAMLVRELQETQKIESIVPYQQIAQTAASYLTLLGERFPPRKTGRHWAVEALEADLSCHYSQHITLRQAAKSYFMNEKYLGRLFFRQTGLSFHQYLNRLRLEHCARMLQYTDRSVLEIALDCGFGNVTYCNRLFLRTYGCTPTEYRKRNA